MKFGLEHEPELLSRETKLAMRLLFKLIYFQFDT